jgi:hypothetical protein
MNIRKHWWTRTFLAEEFKLIDTKVVKKFYDIHEKRCLSLISSNGEQRNYYIMVFHSTHHRLSTNIWNNFIRMHTWGNTCTTRRASFFQTSAYTTVYILRFFFNNILSYYHLITSTMANAVSLSIAFCH